MSKKGKKMKIFQFNLLALIVSLTMLLTACGSSQKAEEPAPEPAATPAAEPAPEPAAAPAAEPAPTSSNATAGQKLIDLNNAREAGAISDEEYEAVKQRLLQAD